MAISAEWQSLVDEKQAKLQAQIPKEWVLPKTITDKVNPESSISAFDLFRETTVLSKEELAITEQYTVASLVEAMVQRKLTSVEVTIAFCKRAAIAQQLTNCLTEIFFDKALESAKRADEYLAREKKPIGPLHGLPISLKDTFMVEGEFASLGFVSYLKKPKATTNSFLVDILLAAGAILYVKTNVPQTLFTCESYNNVFGKTMNPYKLSLTAGGSSSGEGALVGFRGSILGVGSDIGGSIRVPALNNGAYGFKPSVERVPYGGQQALIRKGWPGVLPCAGPLAQSAEDLTLFMKTVLQAKPWLTDSTALAIPWRDVPRKKKLTIGLFIEDPDFPVQPPVKRSLRVAAEKLKAAGHEIIPLTTIPPTMAGVQVAIRSFSLDTTGSVFKFLADAGEEPVKALTAMPMSAYLDNQTSFDLEDMWRFVAERDDYREAWGKIWRKNALDVLLCPGYRGTAPPHDEFGIPAYTLIWNAIDFPASIIPFLKANKSIDVEKVEGFNVDNVEGAPSHVQVVGWRHQDEEVLMATEVIAEVLSSEILQASTRLRLAGHHL